LNPFPENIELRCPNPLCPNDPEFEKRDPPKPPIEAFELMKWEFESERCPWFSPPAKCDPPKFEAPFVPAP
jgi:hypothetical protein